MKKIIAVILLLLLLAGGGYFAFLKYQTKQIQVEFDQKITDIKQYADIKYQNITIYPDLSAELDDVVVTLKNEPKQTYKIKNIIIKKYEQKDNDMSLDIALNGISVKQNIPDAKLKEILKELEPKEDLLINLYINYDYNFAKKHLHIQEISYEIPKLAKTSISLTLDELMLDKTAPLGILTTYPNILLKKTKLTYKDDGLADKTFALIKKEQNLDKETILKQLEMIPLEKDETKVIKNELIKFIKNPKNLNINISPAQPLSVTKIISIFTQIQSADAQNLEDEIIKAMRLFNLTIKAE
jgi:hypothetical protein